MITTKLGRSDAERRECSPFKAKCEGLSHLNVCLIGMIYFGSVKFVQIESRGEVFWYSSESMYFC